MAKILIKDHIVFAFHGLDPLEQKSGNHFRVNLELDFKYKASQNENFEHTVDYGWVIGVVNQCMKEEKKLLETVAKDIIQKLSQHARVECVVVEIYKQKAPVVGNIPELGIQLSSKDVL